MKGATTMKKIYIMLTVTVTIMLIIINSTACTNTPVINIAKYSASENNYLKKEQLESKNFVKQVSKDETLENKNLINEISESENLINQNLESNTISSETSDVTDNAEENNKTEEDVTVLETSYREDVLPFDPWTYADSGIWEIMLDNNDQPFAFGIAAYEGNNYPSYLLHWTKKEQKRESFPEQSLQEKLLNRYKNGTCKIISCVYNGKQAYLFYDYSNLYLLNEKGAVIRKIKIKKIAKKVIKEDSFGIYEFFQKNKKINHCSMIVKAYSSEDEYERRSDLEASYYLININMETGTLSSYQKYPYQIIGADKSYVYGYMDDLVIIEDRKTGEHYQNIPFPKGVLKYSKDGKKLLDYQDFEFDICDHTIYLAARSGIYKLSPLDNGWTKIMEKQYSSYLNSDYTLTDLKVINDNHFYLLGLYGDDEETSTFLAEYTLGEKTAKPAPSEERWKDGFYVYEGELVSYNGTGGEITIPETVTVFPTQIFDNTEGITSISIPASAKTLNYSLYPCLSGIFYQCKDLESITVSEEHESYSSVDGVLFDLKDKCLLRYPPAKPEQSYVQELFVEEIATSAFEGCRNLQECYLHADVNKIDTGAFANAYSLQGIYVDSENETYCSEDGVLFNKDKTTLLQYPAGKQDISYTVPKGVTAIASGAFSGCQHLKEVFVPEQVIEISDGIFSGSPSIEKITFYGLKTMGVNVFSDCTNLQKVSISGDLTFIKNGSFAGCISLETIILPDSVQHFGDASFYRCKSLKQLSMPEQLCTIESMAFEDCSSLQQLTFPENLKSIGSWAFQNCKRIKQITLPKSCITVSIGAFNGCRSLSKIKLSEEMTALEGYVFRECSSLVKISLPKRLKSVDFSAFESCRRLKKLIIPDGVTSLTNLSVGKSFPNCTSLKSVKIPETVKEIDNIKIPKHIKVIGNL